MHPAEIGGGFGGKNVPYIEPVALVLSRKSGHPVKIVMSREDVFKATGPTSGSSMTVKIGVKKDGKIVAADGVFKFQAGAFPGSPVMNACMCGFCALRHPERAHGRLRRGLQPAEGGRLSRPRLADFGLRGGERHGHGRREDRHGPAAVQADEHRPGRERRRSGDRSIRTKATPKRSQALLQHPGYTARRSAKNQGRGVASGYWFNNGGESSAAVHVNEDGTVLVATGSTDISGTRASLAMMAAETLGVTYDQVRPIVADTASIGYGHLTAGSRTTLRDRHRRGRGVQQGDRRAAQARAAMIWNVSAEDVVWEDGCARCPRTSDGKFEPLSLKAIAAKRAVTGGPIVTEVSVNAGGVAPGFATILCDVEVDPETGSVKVLRFVTAQDVGRAIHPATSRARCRARRRRA